MKLKLDADRIDKEVRMGAYSPRIREDFISGVRSGTNGTPSLFLNGNTHDAGFEYEVLSAAIDSLL